VSLGRAHQFDILHRLDALYDQLVVRGRHLRAVVPVGFVAVVFRRVVARGDHDARVGLEVADGEGKLGRRPERAEEVGLDSVGREDTGGDLGEGIRVMPGIVGDAGRETLAGEGFFEVIAEPLRGPAHDEVVHAVVTAADHAPQSSGAELEVAVKAVFELLPILCRDERLDLGAELRILFLRYILARSGFDRFAVHEQPPTGTPKDRGDGR